MKLSDFIQMKISRMNDLASAVDGLPELSKTTYPMLISEEITMSAPHDPALWTEHRAVLTENGWEFQYENRWTDDGCLGMGYRKDGVKLDIFYRPLMDGATCKLNLIGYENKEVPIYEVTCLEA